MLIDDCIREDRVSALGTRWQAVSDRVMGGVSRADLRHEMHAGRPCLHLQGEVLLENSGGFLQMALDLDRQRGPFDARGFVGLRMIVQGNRERYSVHLRTVELARPWQSYRAHFVAPPQWGELSLPFGAFTAHRTEAPLDLARLQRVGLVAIGRAFRADLRLCRLEFYL